MYTTSKLAGGLITAAALTLGLTVPAHAAPGGAAPAGPVQAAPVQAAPAAAAPMAAKAAKAAKKKTTLPKRCRTGKVVCISKRDRKVRYVVNGKIKMSTDARFGGPGHRTREGTFHVFMKSYNHTSTIYHTWMPRAMFFSGGQAVHYSPDFARRGYAGCSHGCVNIRNWNGINSLYRQVHVGDKVVVYW